MDILQTTAQLFSTPFAWTDFLLIGSLVVLEAILSADNAVALAALVKHLPTPEEQNRALRWGIVGAYGFRVLIVVAATWLVDFGIAKLVGAGYLLWLAYQHFQDESNDDSDRIPASATFWQTIVLVELTDIVFSFDSIAASVAISQKTWVIVAGGILGITLMRYMATFFIRWIDEFSRLEDAAYFIIAMVGSRMLIDVLIPNWVVPEWMVMTAVLMVFIWGFSKRELSANQ